MMDLFAVAPLGSNQAKWSNPKSGAVAVQPAMISQRAAPEQDCRSGYLVVEVCQSVGEGVPSD